MTPTPRRGNVSVKSVKLMYFFKNILLYSGTCSIQTTCIVMMTKGGSTKIVNLMFAWEGVLVQGRGQLYNLKTFKKIFSIPRDRTDKVSIQF